MILQILLNSFIIWGVFYATRYNYVSPETLEARKKVIAFCKEHFHGQNLPLWATKDLYPRNEILGFVKKYGDIFLPVWIRKPLYDCPMCMASFWSIMAAVYFGLDKYSDIAPIIFGTCGLNYIFNRLFPYSE
jgi:hypothetical protein